MTIEPTTNLPLKTAVMKSTLIQFNNIEFKFEFCVVSDWPSHVWGCRDNQRTNQHASPNLVTQLGIQI